jgi:hypothetical protein
MIDHGNAPDGDEPQPTGDDATRIIGVPPFDADATRIMPARGTSLPDRAQGAVIGVSAQKAAAADDASDRTVFVPGPSRSAAPDAVADTVTREEFDPAVGWLVIIEGPGRGKSVPVFYGQNAVGRSAEQRIALNFGDTRIAREAHAFVVYDDVGRKFYLRDNGKANLVRLNGQPVMMPTVLNDRDSISIGSTVMKFIALCGPNFDWLAADDPNTAPPSS